MPKILYGILGVAENATQEEIKKAYYRLAKINHPDSNREDPKAKMKFQGLGSAYEVLGDVAKRREYDLRSDGTEEVKAYNDFHALDKASEPTLEKPTKATTSARKKARKPSSPSQPEPTWQEGSLNNKSLKEQLAFIQNRVKYFNLAMKNKEIRINLGKSFYYHISKPQLPKDMELSSINFFQLFNEADLEEVEASYCYPKGEYNAGTWFINPDTFDLCTNACQDLISVIGISEFLNLLDNTNDPDVTDYLTNVPDNIQQQLFNYLINYNKHSDKDYFNSFFEKNVTQKTNANVKKACDLLARYDYVIDFIDALSPGEKMIEYGSPIFELAYNYIEEFIEETQNDDDLKQLDALKIKLASCTYLNSQDSFARFAKCSDEKIINNLPTSWLNDYVLNKVLIGRFIIPSEPYFANKGRTRHGRITGCDKDNLLTLLQTFRKIPLSQQSKYFFINETNFTHRLKAVKDAGFIEGEALCAMYKANGAAEDYLGLTAFGQGELWHLINKKITEDPMLQLEYCLMGLSHCVALFEISNEKNTSAELKTLYNTINKAITDNQDYTTDKSQQTLLAKQITDGLIQAQKNITSTQPHIKNILINLAFCVLIFPIVQLITANAQRALKGESLRLFSFTQTSKERRQLMPLLKKLENVQKALADDSPKNHNDSKNRL